MEESSKTATISVGLVSEPFDYLTFRAHQSDNNWMQIWLPEIPFDNNCMLSWMLRNKDHYRQSRAWSISITWLLEGSYRASTILITTMITWQPQIVPGRWVILCTVIIPLVVFSFHFASDKTLIAELSPDISWWHPVFLNCIFEPWTHWPRGELAFFLCWRGGIDF